MESCQSLQPTVLVSIFFKSFNISFGVIKQISLPQGKHWIGEFCLIRLILEWFMKDCLINSIPWSVSKMLLSRATWVDFFPVEFFTIFTWCSLKISDNSLGILSDYFISSFNNNNFISVDITFICEKRFNCALKLFGGFYIYF